MIPVSEIRQINKNYGDHDDSEELWNDDTLQEEMVCDEGDRIPLSISFDGQDKTFHMFYEPSGLIAINDETSFHIQDMSDPVTLRGYIPSFNSQQQKIIIGNIHNLQFNASMLMYIEEKNIDLYCPLHQYYMNLQKDFTIRESKLIVFITIHQKRHDGIQSYYSDVRFFADNQDGFCEAINYVKTLQKNSVYMTNPCSYIQMQHIQYSYNGILFRALFTQKYNETLTIYPENIIGQLHHYAMKYIDRYQDLLNKAIEETIAYKNSNEWVFETDLEYAQMFLDYIQFLQDQIETHYEELYHYAVSLPYQEQDRFQCLPIDSEMSEQFFFLLCNKNPEIEAKLNDDLSYRLDWHGIPSGAVYNASIMLNRICADHNKDLFLCKKIPQ